MFREPSKIFLGSGFGNLEPLLFEGDLIPYFMLSLKKNVRWGIEISPRIIIRMYNTESFPVRTPSFMPRIMFFYHLIDQSNKKRDLFTYIAWLHHSNRQDGDFYLPDSVNINTRSGNFTSNGIEIGAFLSRTNPFFSANVNYLKFYVAYNYLQDNHLNNIYGRLRFTTDWKSDINLSKILPILRQRDRSHSSLVTQSIRIGWIADDFNNTRKWNLQRLFLQYTLSFQPSFLNNVTIFTQYYNGQDYYNIYFKRTLNVFRLGLASKVNIFN
jgi:hypothetical protein